MSNNSIIDNAKKYIEEIFRGKADGHGVDHTLRVYHNALSIAGHYEDCDTELVSLAALLHDVDDYKLFQTENNANARNFLEKQGLNKDKDRHDL